MTRVATTGRVTLDPGCDGPDDLWAAAVRHEALRGADTAHRAEIVSRANQTAGKGNGE